MSGTTPSPFSLQTAEQAASLLMSTRHDVAAAPQAGSEPAGSNAFSGGMSHQLFQQLIRLSPDCVKILELDGTLRAMSERGQALLRIDNLSAYLGTRWPEWWQGDSRGEAETAVQRAAAGETVKFVAGSQTPSGEHKWFETTLSPISDEAGTPTCLLCISRDVTEQYRTGQHMLLVEQRFRTAFENSIMGFVLSDAVGVVLQANEAFCRIVGRPLEELVGRTSAHMTHPDDVLQNVSSLQSIEEGHISSKTFQKRYLRPDGSIVWTQINVSRVPMRRDDDSVLVCTIEDITEQVKARKALLEREQHLRLIFESVKDYAIMMVDLTGRITEWNSGAEHIFGYTAAEVLGQDSSLLWTEEQRAAGMPEQEFRMARESGGWEGERWQRRKDGSYFFANGRLRPMYDESGKMVGFTKVCQDVTHQREATRLLTEARAKVTETVRAEREKLLDVFKASPSFMAVLRGPEHVYDMVNEEYLKLVGHRGIVGQPIRQALPELDGQGFYELLDHVYGSGEMYQGHDVPVLLQRTPSSPLEERFVDFVYLPAKDPDGTIQGIFVHGVDQTERRKAEKSLGVLAEQRRLALEAADMGWWHLNVQTGEVEWDDRVKKILSIQSSSMDLESVLAVIHPDDRQMLREAIEAAVDVAQPKPYYVEYRVQYADGSIHWVQSQGRAYFEDSPQRHAVSLVGTALDITQMKLAQETLRESEARFRQMADVMPQIVYTTRPDGVHEYFNQRWYEYTGMPVGSTDESVWRLAFDEKELPQIFKAWETALLTGNPYEYEYKLRRHDGVFCWHLVRALPIRNEKGEIIRWAGTSTNIDEQKKLLAQNELLLGSERHARESAERAGRIKDEFLATLSHELRTPLSAILGWCTLLKDEPDDADLEEGVSTIERNARAQSQIIEDLLDMSAIISGKIRLHMQHIDPVPVVRAAVETVRPAADAKGVEITLTVDPGMRRISGDPNRLQQVFWNLLSNAVKFTPKGGKILIEMGSSQSQHVFRVQDSGEGIDAEFLPAVFDRFRQADATITRRHGGLGLGLAIVKQLVELHGGLVTAHSAGGGQGATFTVSLPIAAVLTEPPGTPEKLPVQAGDTSPPMPKHARNLEGLRVLIVDDEPDARNLVRRFLTDCKATVRSADSAEQAFQMFTEEVPDLIVSDVGMPKEDGYSLIKRIRALPADQGGNVPAIALTAYARSEDRMKAVVSGFQMHVAKPAEAAELLTMVASLSGRMGT